jgi:curved DNA-binding protein CbpA
MTQQALDPYAVLGIPRDASAQVARRAYRRLAKRYHPDLHPEALTSERMRRINRAWEIVSIPARRARYDADNPPGGPRGSGHWSPPTRSSSQTAPAREPWEPAWASASQAAHRTQTGGWADPTGASRPYRTAPATPDQWDEGSGWRGGLVTAAAVLLVIGAIIVGLLPPPLLAFVLLLAGRWIFSRFD